MDDSLIYELQHFFVVTDKVYATLWYSQSMSPKVYFTKEITPESLVRIYQKLEEERAELAVSAGR